MNRSAVQDIGGLIGRILMSATFIWSGLGNLLDPVRAANAFANFGIPLPELGWMVAVMVQIVGGLVLLPGIQPRLIALIERTD